MADVMSARRDASRETQLHGIRNLMLRAARRGAWLTLSEIAGLTEIGEASVSAQLRHLRKRRFGRHLVEKRPRRRPRWVAVARSADGKRCARRARVGGERAVWEYRVLPPARRKTAASAHESPGR
jgi:hypothetical protein